ncbi:MAG TPA: TIGR03118 family protein [Byssovorax sp.]|jgi:uncharacterized protein (TIGR03118 family)
MLKLCTTGRSSLAIAVGLAVGIASVGCSDETNSDMSAAATTGAGASTSTGATGAGGSTLSTARLRRRDLVSDEAGAAQRDADLVNPWGVAFDPDALTGASFWVADNHSGVATIYDASGDKSSLVVTIPAIAGETTSAPTGQVYNGSPHFKGDRFIFDSEDGTIVGWSSGTQAVVRVDRSAGHASYKGLAIATSGAPRLYATDFRRDGVEMFDGDYALMSVEDAFRDDSIPAGFAPFNVAFIDDRVYVTYAMQDADKADDQPGPGNGYIDVFDADGALVKRLASRGVLNSPWAMAKAPTGFGSLSGALLVGNFGDGRIHAFDIETGELKGAVLNTAGAPLVIDGLWTLTFGPGSELVPIPARPTSDLRSTLFFTAGPGDESHGRFGKLELVAP